MLLTNNFKKILYLSVLFGFIGSVAGLVMAWFLDIPSGAAIIFTLVLEYIIGSLAVKVGSLRKRRLSIP